MKFNENTNSSSCDHLTSLTSCGYNCFLFLRCIILHHCFEEIKYRCQYQFFCNQSQSDFKRENCFFSFLFFISVKVLNKKSEPSIWRYIGLKTPNWMQLDYMAREMWKIVYDYRLQAITWTNCQQRTRTTPKPCNEILFQLQFKVFNQRHPNHSASKIIVPNLSFVCAAY